MFSRIILERLEKGPLTDYLAFFIISYLEVRRHNEKCERGFYRVTQFQEKHRRCLSLVLLILSQYIFVQVS